MNKTSVLILRAFSRKPMTIPEAASLVGTGINNVNTALKAARNEGRKIEKMGHTPHTHFYMHPDEFRKVKWAMKDEIIAILKAGDAWTYKELAELLNVGQEQIRRCCNDILKRELLALNVRTIRVGNVYCTQLQYKYSEQPCF